MKFTEFGFQSELEEGIAAIGFEDATPIQEKAIPEILLGKDLIASAQTGTGKTAAFLLPIINKMLSTDHNQIKCMVVVPTRELAIQIDQQMEGLSYYASVSSVAVYGGSDGESFTREKKAMEQGADMIICTPGRMISHLNLGYVPLDNLQYLILDEADRMLDMGFSESLNKIFSYLPKKRQGLLFSATMPPKIRALAKTVLNNPVEINIAVSKPAEKIIQAAFVIYEAQKIPLVEYLLTARPFKSVIIFCSTKDSVKQLTRSLQRKKLSVDQIHSDLDQTERENVLTHFKSKKLNVLIATDILSRGVDIEDIDLVINFDVPNEGEDYIHRIGRTARAASKGAAFTFISEKEQGKFARIEELLGKPVQKVSPPENLGDTPAYKPRKNSGGGKKGYKKPFRKKSR